MLANSKKNVSRVEEAHKQLNLNKLNIENKVSLFKVMLHVLKLKLKLPKQIIICFVLMLLCVVVKDFR